MGVGGKLFHLAEGLLKKHIASHSLHEPEALCVYITLLEQQSKYGNALEILSGPLGSPMMIEVDKSHLQLTEKAYCQGKRFILKMAKVEGRLLPKIHGSGKTFPGPQALKTLSYVQKWLNELCEELSERLQSDLEHNKRIAHTLTLHLNDSESLKKFPSKSCPLRYGTTKIQEDSLSLFHTGLCEYIGVYNVNKRKQPT